MPGHYVVGVDVGAPNTKALLYDLEMGQVVAVASRPTLVHHPAIFAVSLHLDNSHATCVLYPG